MKDIQRFYTVMEVAVVLGVSKSTVYNLIAQGELTSVRIGKRNRRVAQAALQEMLNRCETTAAY